MAAFLHGLVASLSIVAGYFPVALSFGLAATEAGLAPAMVLLISVLVYAGASQFLMIGLLASGAGLATSVPTVLLMNARHLFYGPAVGNTLRHAGAFPVPAPALAFGLTDEVFATAMARIHRIPDAQRQAWLLGLACGAYTAWLAGTLCGLLLVSGVAAWPLWLREALAFVLPALFFTLLLESGMRQWWLAIAGAAVSASLLLAWLPAHHALALAIVMGAACHAGRSYAMDADPAHARR